jgi:hypothetical protein
MCRVRRRGPDRDGTFDAVLRAVVVVALLAGAGLALQARQGLDWDALSDPVQVRWARVLMGAVLLAMVATLARRLLHRLRKPRRPPVQDGRTEAEAEPFPFLLRVLAVALVLAAFGLAWFIIDAVSNPATHPVPPPDPDQPTDPGDATAELTTSWPVLALVAALLVMTVGAARLLGGRRDRDGDTDGGPADEATDAADAAELSAAVRAAQGELGGHDDARAAIIAAYAAMAASISVGLTRRGASPRSSDTPTELLERAAAAGLVGDGPATTLTSLFREARFSRHPMGEPQRRAAEQALVAVRDELAASRA